MKTLERPVLASGAGETGPRPSAPADGDDREYRGLIQDFADWCLRNNLQINAGKTKELVVVDFRRRRHSPPAPVSIQGTDIDTVKSYKYLGVHLNDSLDWSDNTNALVKKGNSRLFLLRRLRSFGVQGPLLRTFYDSVVASAIFYGIVCWVQQHHGQGQEENGQTDVAAARGSLCYGSYGDSTSHNDSSRGVNLSGPKAHGSFHHGDIGCLPAASTCSSSGPVLEPRVGNPERYAGELRSVHYELFHPLRSVAPDVFIGRGKSCVHHQPPDGPSSSTGNCRVGAADPTPACPSKPSGTYAIDFRTKAHLSDWNEAARCDAFLRGLGEYLKDELVSYELPLSFDDLVKLTRLAVRRDIRLKDTSPPRFDRARPQATEEATSNSHTREPKSMQIGRTRLTPEECARCRQGNLCLYCGQASHFVSRCPAKGTDSPVLPSTTPPRGCLYSLSAPEREAKEVYINDSLAAGIIWPSSSPAGGGFFFVEKKDKTLRPCIDYHGLNDITIKNRYPLPLISSAFELLDGATVFTKLDLRNACHLVRIREGDKWKTAFNTPTRHDEYLVVPFGLTNAPAVTRRSMSTMCKPVLQRLLENSLFVKAEKCEFHASSVSFLGFIVGPGSLQMDPAKVSAVTSWPTPSSRKQLQWFLGSLAGRSQCIEATFQWSVAANESFDTLKTRFTSAPILIMPDLERQFVFEVDASDVGVGAVLSQWSSEDQKLHPCAFFSRRLLPAERNYDIGNRELLAVKLALEEWRHWLEGSREHREMPPHLPPPERDRPP
ncbi:hypothetical protein L3Q82_010778 [Scortum barcoo]|uniref:Uncharacterized protein n=1 Tax=Scortum barcoo TaxID=214431 RepID=A0ACB8W7K0_9TELE|nr:hypothetical protein L3Q82_010778 [Scortum barcoo]